MHAATDTEIEAALTHAAPEQKQRYLDTLSAWAKMPEALRVRWSGGEEIEPKVWKLAYPDYAEEFWTLRGLITDLSGEATYDWASDSRFRGVPLVEPAILEEQSLSDLVRINFMLGRKERFSEGIMSEFIESGAYDVIFERVAKFLRTAG